MEGQAKKYVHLISYRTAYNVCEQFFNILGKMAWLYEGKQCHLFSFIHRNSQTSSKETKNVATFMHDFVY